MPRFLWYPSKCVFLLSAVFLSLIYIEFTTGFLPMPKCTPGNIMIRRNAGKIYGVLNDFDLASRLDITTDDPTSDHWTGTRPYKALDLLDTDQLFNYLYRHDLQSLFYIILCLVCRYEKPGHRLKNSPFSSWFLGSDQNVFLDKKAIITANKTPIVSPHFFRVLVVDYSHV